jgi:hypothetical protein
MESQPEHQSEQELECPDIRTNDHLERVQQLVLKKTKFPMTVVLQVCDLGLGLNRDNYIYFAEQPRIII